MRGNYACWRRPTLLAHRRFGPGAMNPVYRYAARMTETSTPDVTPAAPADPAYRAAVIDLLAAIAYGELSAFERLVDDAKLSPTLADKIALDTMASVQFGHVQPLLDRITELGGDPIEAMKPFTKPFDAFHAKTAPSDWYEGLIKAYVGEGLTSDFYREITAFVDEDTRRLILESLQHAGQADFVVARVRAAIAADQRIGGRLALWGRRLMGEALSQAQRVAAERDSLAALLAGGIDRPGLDLAALTRMFSRLTENHTARMAELELDA